MEMEFEKFIPADEEFIAHVDAAFAKQRAVFAHNIDAMRQCADASDEGKHVALIDENGEEEEYFPPEYMEFTLGEIDHLWAEMRQEMIEARTAQGQVGAVFTALREAFSTACYTGNAPLMPRFFDAMVNDIAAHYEPTLEVPDAAAEEQAGKVKRIGTSPRQFFESVVGDMCSYGDLALGALQDIETLTECYEHAHGKVGEEAARSPYDLTYRRYCAARDIDYKEEGFTIPEEDKDAFVRKQQKFYVKELFAPFSDVLPEDQCPEMAWFMGAAIEAIRIEDGVQHVQNQSVVDRILKRGKQTRPLSLHAANDHEPTLSSANAETLHEEEGLGSARSAEWPIRSAIEIMNDPKAVQRMKDMLDDVFTDFPEMARNPGDIVAAKEYFMGMYLEYEGAKAVEGPAR